jgi:thiamine phosphate synthase YjbQ (UPF0047 family)
LLRKVFVVGFGKKKGQLMKSYRKELWFQVPGRRAFINITPEVETCLKESGIKEGLVLCNAKHMNFIMPQ